MTVRYVRTYVRVYIYVSTYVFVGMYNTYVVHKMKKSPEKSKGLKVFKEYKKENAFDGSLTYSCRFGGGN